MRGTTAKKLRKAAGYDMRLERQMHRIYRWLGRKVLKTIAGKPTTVTVPVCMMVEGPRGIYRGLKQLYKMTRGKRIVRRPKAVAA